MLSSTTRQEIHSLSCSLDYGVSTQMITVLFPYWIAFPQQGDFMAITHHVSFSKVEILIGLSYKQPY